MNVKILFQRVIVFAITTVIVTSTISPPTKEVKADENGGIYSDYKTIGKVTKILTEGNKVNIDLQTGEKVRLTFLTKDVFRLNMEPKGNFVENAVPLDPNHTTTIIAKKEAEYEKENVVAIKLSETAEDNVISTDKVEIRIDKQTSTMELENKETGEVIWSEAEPLMYKDNETVQTLATDKDEYFYGCGQQNGYFSHKGTVVDIVNENNWNDGGASSPSPFYISTKGYGAMRHTFKKGHYDFGASDASKVRLKHEESRFDVFYFVGGTMPKVLDEYTELTGRPQLLPTWAFYQGHADNFTGSTNGGTNNRTLMTTGVEFAKGYVDHDMPRGWILPNDGYGSDYKTIENLKNFVDKAKEYGFRTGLWTQRDLTRIANEVGIAGTRGVKTDVAWVGHGYSFALDAVRIASEGIEKNSAEKARPFIVSIDGWAGTQRYAGLWAGDQTGGNWEYIRMHIPTLIGAGLSGNPNVGSDIDGIFGGSAIIQTRDLQWKAFTPIMINMSGWAGVQNEKTPWNYGEPYTSINRMYLKLKAEMLPYFYTYAAKASQNGTPMVRAMVLEYPQDPYTKGKQTQYQYMWGENLLVAPMYRGDENSSSIRNNIYLPDSNQVWIDYFTGEQYQGGAVQNNFSAPLWKVPLFVKNGAIIPMAVPNNSTLELEGNENRIFDIYPSGDTNFTLYEDDSNTQEYKAGKSATTQITSSAPKTGKGTATVTVKPTVGSYTGMEKERGTEFIINTREVPTGITATVGGASVTLTKVTTEAEFDAAQGNVYFYNAAPNLNKKDGGTEFNNISMITSPKLYVKLAPVDRTTKEVKIVVNGFNNTQTKAVTDEAAPATPVFNAVNQQADVTDTSITLKWNDVEGADSYDLIVDGMIYRNVKSSHKHEGLTQNTKYLYKLRANNTFGASEWTNELEVTTNLDRYRNVPKGMTITADCIDQPGNEISKAVDGDDSTLWHTKWLVQQSPIEVKIDMKSAYNLEKFEYTPRPDGANGTILEYSLSYSLDGVTWKSQVENGVWQRNGQVKTTIFDKPITARYLKLNIKNAVGGFGSAQEFRPYKVEDSKVYPVGDYNQDGQITNGDLTFLQNYVGIKNDDRMWGYVERADINFNGVIDAYDLAFVSSQLDGGMTKNNLGVQGTINLRPSKTALKAGDSFSVDLVALGFLDVNAFDLELLLDTEKYQVAAESSPCNATALTAGMINFSKVLEDGSKERVYGIFANRGNKTKINGSGVLATINLTAKVDMDFDIEINNATVVSSSFNMRDAKGNIMMPGEAIPQIEAPILKVNPSDITLTTKDNAGNIADIAQPGLPASNIFDGDPESIFDMNWSNVYSMPVTFGFEFNNPRSVSKITIYNRGDAGVGGNGRIKKVHTYGYKADNTKVDLGITTAASSVVSFDVSITQKQLYKKVELVFEESHSSATLLAIGEIDIFAEDTNYVPVTGISFDVKNATVIRAGEKISFNAITTPENATNKYIVMTSSNSSVKVIRNVDESGNITFQVEASKEAVNKDIVTIKATSIDGNFSVSTNIEVLNEISKTTLSDAIVSAQAKYDAAKVGEGEGQYPQAAKEALLAAITAATTVKDNNTATQEEIEAAVAALKTAVTTFESQIISVVDKGALNTAIVAAQAKYDVAEVGGAVGQYPKTAKYALSVAINVAKTVYNNSASTQTNIAAALKALNNAVTTFNNSIIK